MTASQRAQSRSRREDECLHVWRVLFQGLLFAAPLSFNLMIIKSIKSIEKCKCLKTLFPWKQTSHLLETLEGFREEKWTPPPPETVDVQRSVSAERGVADGLTARGETFG